MQEYKVETVTDKVVKRIDALVATEVGDQLQGLEELKMDIEDFNNCGLFCEGVLSRIKKLKNQENPVDMKEAMEFLRQSYQEQGITFIRPTVKNWLGENPPGSGSRELVYQLCFVLKMDAEKTKEFFLKNYLNRPFNYKNIREAVYYWCMCNEQNYQKAVEIIEKIQSASVENVSIVDMNTVQVGEKIKGICKEQELIDFLCQCQFGLEQQYRTATDKIEGLLKDCYNCANEEVRAFSDLYSEFYKKNGRVKEIGKEDLLLEVIYGSAPSKIGESRLPKLIRKNFPRRQLFFNIRMHKASEDVIRKALIILVFYRFYANALICGNGCMDFREEYEDFQVELNEILLECGYVQMYVRNSFDFFIIYCAKTCNPLDTFRGLIAEYQCDGEEEQSEELK